jgi:hypothetical protein
MFSSSSRFAIGTVTDSSDGGHDRRPDSGNGRVHGAGAGSRQASECAPTFGRSVLCCRCSRANGYSEAKQYRTRSLRCSRKSRIGTSCCQPLRRAFDFLCVDVFEKREQRLHDIADAGIEIDETLAQGPKPEPADPTWSLTVTIPPYRVVATHRFCAERLTCLPCQLLRQQTEVPVFVGRHRTVLHNHRLA